MGIPKFFRYISERWPTISNLVNGNIVPEFDNLYLDMNSIIHTCTHKDDDDAMHRMTEQEMMIAIFNYIEHLFSIIKPQKVFYMAIDGVAPRAKMNQQRSRRFKSAKEAEEGRRKAILKGTELPKEEPFDSNSITPGTEFMANLTRHLKHFINRKITEDSSWQNIEVILSGHEVPGEGEHKIMNFLRTLRSTPDYNQNTRHCLYGLDADLIMLGLSSHEPHFSLLREEVVFNRRETSHELSEKRFFLLHLSLVREYMQLEFSRVIQKKFDFERILDDFILINFFIGNDFLPETPMLLINDGALPVIFETYMDYLIESNDYLSHDGVINFQQLKLWLKRLSAHQTAKFEEQAMDAEWLNNELGDLSLDEKIILTQHEKDLIRSVKPFVLGCAATENLDDYSFRLPPALTLRDTQILGLLAGQTSLLLVDETLEDGAIVTDIIVDTSKFPADEEGKHNWLKETRKIFKTYEKADIQEEKDRRQELYSRKLNQWRNNYYRKKLHVKQDDERVKSASKHYLEGLQWVLSYYYRGCPSWSWYFPEHYAPMTSDLFDGITPEFDVSFGPSTPFKPFEQLMGVLPDRSAALVPPAYRDLMASESSPIIDFYPHDFETDKNGKKYEWESVVLIPFIDANRLQETLAKRENQLTAAEKERNGMGSDLLFTFDPNQQSTYPASAPWLHNIVGCTCVTKSINPHDLDASKVVYGILPNSKTGKNMHAGFPSINTLDYTFKIESASVKVFERQSLIDSVCLTIKNTSSENSLEDIAPTLVNSITYIGYPFLHEAKIVAVSNDTSIYKGSVREFSDPKLKREIIKQRDDTLKMYRSTKAIYYKSSNLVAHCNRLKGLERSASGDYKKIYSNEVTVFPIELLVENVVMEDQRFAERKAGPIHQEYPLGSNPILLLQKNYGSQTQVTGFGDGKVNVDVLSIQEGTTSYAHEVAKLESRSQRYYVGGEIARKFRLSPLLFSQLTSRAMFKWGEKKYNIGLVLKKPAQNLKALGYSRKEGTSWTYSDAAADLFGQYFTTFKAPLNKLIEMMAQGSGGITDAKKILKDSDKDGEAIHEALKQISTWVEKASDALPFVDVDTERLSKKSVALIEEWAREIATKRENSTALKINNVHRGALLSLDMTQHQLSKQHFYLGDRVMVALDHGKVAQFARGIVVGLSKQANGTSVEVLFDNELSAGSSLDGRVASKRGLTVDSGSLLNITTKELAYDRSSAFIPAEALSQDNRRTARSNGNAHQSGGKFAPAQTRGSAWTKGQNQPVNGASAVPPPAHVPAAGTIPATIAAPNKFQGQYSVQQSQQLFDQIKSSSEKHAKAEGKGASKKSDNGKKPKSQKNRSNKPEGKPEQKKVKNKPIGGQDALAALQAELGLSGAAPQQKSAPAPVYTAASVLTPAPASIPVPIPPAFGVGAFQQNANNKDSESLLKLLRK